MFSWQSSVSLCPVSFCTPRSNLPVTPGSYLLPTLHSVHCDKKDLFMVLVLEVLHKTSQSQLLWQ